MLLNRSRVSPRRNIADRFPLATLSKLILMVHHRTKGNFEQYVRHEEGDTVNRVQASVGLFHLSSARFCKLPRDVTARVEETLVCSLSCVKRHDGLSEL